VRVGLVETEERFHRAKAARCCRVLRFASRHVRGSEREEKASARFGRNDSKLSWVS
jgi:hypothetical protein